MEKHGNPLHFFGWWGCFPLVFTRDPNGNWHCGRHKRSTDDSEFPGAKILNNCQIWSNDSSIFIIFMGILKHFFLPYELENNFIHVPSAPKCDINWE